MPQRESPSGPASEIAALRRRVADLEGQLLLLRKSQEAIDGPLPAREALLAEAERIAHLGSWVLNLETGEVKWSEELFRILGFDPRTDTATTDKYFHALHPDDQKTAREGMDRLLREGVIVPGAARLVWKDGTIREALTDGAVVRDGNGRILRVVGTVLDVTETRRADRELRRSAGLLQAAQRLAKVGSWYWDAGAGVLEWSEELYRIFAVNPAEKPTRELFSGMVHPEDREKWRESRDRGTAAGRGGPLELRIILGDGSLRHVLVHATRLEGEGEGSMKFLGTVWDITERKRLEEQLRQSQKMEAVGRVAAGVAHDFNNLLTIISGNVDLLLEDAPDEKLRRIGYAAEVGTALTRQLLSMSRQAMVQPAVLDLNQVIRDTGKIIQRLIGEDIEMHFHLDEKAVLVLADPGQMQQILLNLAVNGRDAMTGGGKLFITTREEADGSGPWACLMVRDSGSGMDKATQERIFEPFFTTKEPGKGTGLGLSTVQGIVSQNGGRIAVDSAPGRGTTVAIRFPCYAGPAAASPAAASPAPGGVESILLVEDNTDLRELVRSFLAGAGYQVQAVGRPGEAEALWEKASGTIDLLITDLVMPEKNGKLLAAGLRASKPALKTLYISGYAPPGAGGETDRHYLQKPFTRNELLRAVRAVCEGRPPWVSGKP